MSTQQLLITAIVLIVTPSTLIMASPQRPSYAGSRPSGGLNQKDKYHQQFDNSNNSANAIENRFSDIEANRLPANASQRPPVGVPIVTPLPIYEPLPTRTQINFDNRIGGTDQNQSSTAPPILPFDALGDRDLYNQLSSLPEHQRPFWFLNAQAIQAHRNGSAPFAGALASRGSFFG